MGKSVNYSRAWALGEGLNRALEELVNEREVLIAGLEGAAQAFALARVWMAAPRTCLAVCPTLPLAEKLTQDLDFFLAGDDKELGPVRLFPAYEVSPYEELDPPPEVTAQRLAVLWDLMSGDRPLLVVTSPKGLTPRLCPAEHLLDNYLELEAGMEIERDVLAEALVQGGYTHVSLVEQAGEFAVRGAVVDFFGPLLDDPVRVEFFGDEIESLRRFDPADQRSQADLSSADLIPCHPVDLSPQAVKRAVERLRRMAREEGFSARRLMAMVERMELRAPFTGLETLLGLYFANPSDLFAFLPDDCRRVIIEPQEVEERLSVEAERLEEEYEECREEGRLVVPPSMLRRTPAQTNHSLSRGPRIFMKTLAVAGERGGKQPITIRAGAHTGLHTDLAKGDSSSLLGAFVEWVEDWGRKGLDVVLVCRSFTQVERLGELLAEKGVEFSTQTRASLAKGRGQGSLFLVVGGLSAGFIPWEAGLTFVTEDEVFGAPRVVRQKTASRLSTAMAKLDDLSPGDKVVHVDHGIGRYEGLMTLVVGPAESDFLQLTYKDGDKLYVPADRMGLISKYRAPEDGGSGLDRLGGAAWARTKRKVQKAVEAIARDLVELYAARSFLKGHALDPPDSGYREFEASFLFSETPDQAKAIEDVVADLTSPQPMDRLVCGDVGYGKTEVALRAAYLASSAGRQVALLTPTTVLAEQHYQTFSGRLKSYPLEVRSLSRFKTPAQQKEVLGGLAAGQVDVVIGTHRLLQKDVVFKNLGLVILDEEQRFGVKDKEKLKKLRKLVDVLALTATPIPRTMQMSLAGIRDLSVINTAPEDRQSIKTYLSTFSPRAVREAIEREMNRSGQVFFVHNRVKDLGRMARMVMELVPKARVGVAHGQLKEKSLEKVMLSFVSRELDVLVCTTIIESGLDIPSANTIIINEADKLGLSQIYQLRGRVGRSPTRAYAYLFIKSENSISKHAQKRLKALMDFTHLGAGFAIAMHDLQIRGAGNLLGEVQSGRVAEVGYELYVRMLEEAVARMGGEEVPEGPEPELRLYFPAHLPENYVPDPQVRLSIYKRLSYARKPEELGEVAADLEDRFGPPPSPAENLIAAVEMKQLLRGLSAVRLDLSRDTLQVHFAHSPRVNMDKLLGMAGDPAAGIKIFSEGKVSVNLESGDSPFDQARRFLQYISLDDN